MTNITKAVSSRYTRVQYGGPVGFGSADLRTTPLHMTEPPAEYEGWLRDGASGAVVDRRRGHFFGSKRSRFITFVQAATKSWTNFGPASSVA